MNFWDELMGSDEGAANYMESYGEGPGFVTRAYVGSLIHDGESVLDVGCGPGWNLDHFKQYGPEVNYRGLDYSERFVRVANQRHPVLRNPYFFLGDVRDINEPDESWDVVIVQDCLEHTNGYEKPVAEALRVAKRLVIISFWHLSGNEGTEHINDDGNDGWGAWYDQTKWEGYLNDLPYVWEHHEVIAEGKTHTWDFYLLHKEPS